LVAGRASVRCACVEHSLHDHNDLGGLMGPSTFAYRLPIRPLPGTSARVGDHFCHPPCEAMRRFSSRTRLTAQARDRHETLQRTVKIDIARLYRGLFGISRSFIRAASTCGLAPACYAPQHSGCSTL
jgi:hypothetical protein